MSEKAQICPGVTYIALDGEWEEVKAECETYNGDCGFKVKLSDHGDYIDPDREDWAVTSHLMDKYHKLHLAKRSQVKIERGL